LIGITKMENKIYRRRLVDGVISGLADKGISGCRIENEGMGGLGIGRWV
jgi:hypothetical protein